MSLVRFLPVSPQISNTPPPQIRLPVKSLLPLRSGLRYRCIGKNWNRSLITSSFSDKEPLHHDENPTRLLISGFTSTTLEPNPPIIHLFPEKILPGVIPVPEKPSYLQIPVGLEGVVAVDGIFFLYKDYHRMALWNPSMGEFRPLPVDFMESITPSSPRDFKYTFGFGFDPISQDYKVVCVSFLTDIYHLWFASVYSLNNDSWKIIDCNFDAGPIMLDSQCSTCVNGFYYWCTLHLIDCKWSALIRYFDMHNEVFGEIPGPVDYMSSLDHCKLTIYKESICLLVRHCSFKNDVNPPIDVWLLNDDRSWTKVVNVMPTNIEPLKVVPTNTEPLEVVPLGTWDQDKFIFYSDKEILLFDPKTREFTHLLDMTEATGDCYRGYFDILALSYRKSRVSIKGDILDHMQNFFDEDSEDESNVTMN